MAETAAPPKQKMSTTTKVIMGTTIGLIVLGTVAIFGYAIYNSKVRIAEPTPATCEADEDQTKP